MQKQKSISFENYMIIFGASALIILVYWVSSSMVSTIITPKYTQAICEEFSHKITTDFKCNSYQPVNWYYKPNKEVECVCFGMFPISDFVTLNNMANDYIGIQKPVVKGYNPDDYFFTYRAVFNLTQALHYKDLEYWGFQGVR